MGRDQTMLDDGKLQALARPVAALDSEDVGRLSEAVRTRKAEAHLAELRAMSDEDVMLMMFSRHHDNRPNPNALRLLRDAGFVRHAGIEAAYRAGFAASGEGWNGERPSDAAERPSFARRMQTDLDAIRSQQRGGL